MLERTELPFRGLVVDLSFGERDIVAAVRWVGEIRDGRNDVDRSDAEPAERTDDVVEHDRLAVARERIRNRWIVIRSFGIRGMEDDLAVSDERGLRGQSQRGLELRAIRAGNRGDDRDDCALHRPPE